MVKKRLSEEEKIQIIKYHDTMSIAKLAFQLQRPRSTVYFFIQRWFKSHTLANKRNPGRPQIHLDSKKIIQYIKRHPMTTIRELKTKLNLKICEKSISKSLHKLGFKKRKMLRKAFLDDQHRQSRLKFCQKYFHWTNNDWAQTLYADETFLNFKMRIGLKGWRRKGESMKKNQIVEMIKSGKRVSLWGCFSARGASPLYLLKKNLTGSYYQDILSKNLIKNGRKLIGNSFWFFDDNHSSHRTKIVNQFLQKKNITRISYPSLSSDLQPIEHLFAYLKKGLAIAKPALNIEQMVGKARRIWKKIPPSLCVALTNSMRNRIRACILAKGGPTKY
jgi:transposase